MTRTVWGHPSEGREEPVRPGGTHRGRWGDVGVCPRGVGHRVGDGDGTSTGGVGGYLRRRVESRDPTRVEGSDRSPSRREECGNRVEGWRSDTSSKDDTLGGPVPRTRDVCVAPLVGLHVHLTHLPSVLREEWVPYSRLLLVLPLVRCSPSGTETGRTGTATGATCGRPGSAPPPSVVRPTR